MIDLAAKMISEGRGMDLMPREANPDAPITAYRYIVGSFSKVLNCFQFWFQLFVEHKFRIYNSKIPLELPKIP